MDIEETIEKIKKKGSGIGILILATVILLVMFNPFVTIGAGERGVIMTWGAVGDDALGEGLHLAIPFMQKVMKMDVKVQKSETNADASSKDLQTVSSTVALNYHILPDKANVVYQTLGIQFKERIIDPAVQEVVKAVSAKYTAEELITKRPKVGSDMRGDLKSRLLKHNIVVDEFSIVNFSFSQAYQNEIEAKQVAEQRVKKATLELNRIKIEKQQKITQAQAEAEALRLQKRNISTDLLKLRQIEAAMKAIEKWDGVLPKVTSGAIPFIDVKSFESRK